MRFYMQIRNKIIYQGILGDFRLPGLQTFDQLAEAHVSLHWMAPEVLTSQVFFHFWRFFKFERL